MSSSCAGDGGAVLTVYAIVAVGATLITLGVTLITVGVGSREGDRDAVESKVMKQTGTLHQVVI